MKNDVTVGTFYDKVWRNNSHPKPPPPAHIFGMRIVLNADQWDPSGLSFNANDLVSPAAPSRIRAGGVLPR